MIRERQPHDPCLRRPPHDLGGRYRSVARRRMKMQVDPPRERLRILRIRRLGLGTPGPGVQEYVG